MKLTITGKDKRKLALCLLMSFCLCSMPVSLMAAEGSHQGKSKMSLIETAPALYKTAKRYFKFYGDENTFGGSLFDRSYLFGSAGGVRDSLIDHGIYLDLGVTQFIQGNTSDGKRTTSSHRSNSTTIYRISLQGIYGTRLYCRRAGNKKKISRINSAAETNVE
jgi:hypothetical protein